MNTPPVGRNGIIGIIGAGKSGIAIARLALDTGYKVKIASSGTAPETALMTDIISPGTIAVETADVVDGVDILVPAVPLRRFSDLPLHILSGQTVIDIMNYWPPIDGPLPDYEDTHDPTSAIIQNAISGAEVVKTFNHLAYNQMEDLARRPDAPDRVALDVAGNDTAATDRVMDFVNAVGFDPVHIGTLGQSDVLQPQTPIFGAALNATGLEGRVPSAVRQ